MLKMFSIKIFCKDGSFHSFCEEFFHPCDAQVEMMGRYPDYESIDVKPVWRVH